MEQHCPACKVLTARKIIVQCGLECLVAAMQQYLPWHPSISEQAGGEELDDDDLHFNMYIVKFAYILDDFRA